MVRMRSPHIVCIVGGEREVENPLNQELEEVDFMEITGGQVSFGLRT